MEDGKSVVLNDEMRRRSQDSSSSTLHSAVLVTEDRGGSKFRGHNEREEVERRQSLDSRMLHLTIARRIGIRKLLERLLN